MSSWAQTCVYETVANLSAETTIRLSHIDNIIGTKEASGNFQEIAKIISSTKNDFKVWSGNDEDTLPLLSIGAYGVVSVVSHLAGKQIKDMIESFLACDIKRAAEIHYSLMPLFKTMFITANPYPLKYALNYLGFHVGKLWLPLVEPDEASAAIIREVLGNSVIDIPLP